jgi:hypothetical protein
MLTGLPLFWNSRRDFIGGWRRLTQPDDLG